MREIMLASGYSDPQWRRYEGGGSLNVASLMRVALGLNATLSELLDGLGQWPRCSVAAIQMHNGIIPESDTEPDMEPAVQLASGARPKRKPTAVRSVKIELERKEAPTSKDTARKRSSAKSPKKSPRSGLRA